MNKKYELTNVTREFRGRTLHQIRALRDFADVRLGDLGGFIENESNLSDSCSCWVAPCAVVYGDAQVSGDALACGNAAVYGAARVFDHAIIADEAEVFDFAIVSGHANIFGRAQVMDCAVVRGHAWVSERASVSGTAHIGGNLTVRGEAQISGNANLHGADTICGRARISSGRDFVSLCVARDGTTAAFYRSEDGIGVSLPGFDPYGLLWRFEELYGGLTDDYPNAAAAVKLAREWIGGAPR